MPEFGGEGIEELAGRLAQLADRQAANVRALAEEIERHRREAREQGRNFSALTGAQILDRLEGRALSIVFERTEPCQNSVARESRNSPITWRR